MIHQTYSWKPASQPPTQETQQSNNESNPGIILNVLVCTLGKPEVLLARYLKPQNKFEGIPNFEELDERELSPDKDFTHWTLPPDMPKDNPSIWHTPDEKPVSKDPILIHTNYSENNPFLGFYNPENDNYYWIDSGEMSQIATNEFKHWTHLPAPMVTYDIENNVQPQKQHQTEITTSDLEPEQTQEAIQLPQPKENENTTTIQPPIQKPPQRPVDQEQTPVIQTHATPQATNQEPMPYKPPPSQKEPQTEKININPVETNNQETAIPQKSITASIPQETNSDLQKPPQVSLTKLAEKEPQTLKTIDSNTKFRIELYQISNENRPKITVEQTILYEQTNLKNMLDHLNLSNLVTILIKPETNEAENISWQDLYDIVSKFEEQAPKIITRKIELD